MCDTYFTNEFSSRMNQLTISLPIYAEGRNLASSVTWKTLILDRILIRIRIRSRLLQMPSTRACKVFASWQALAKWTFYTACTIATSLIHSKIDYCNSLLLNLPATQTNHLQLVLNAAARAVTKTRKFHHITHILKSLHWLKIGLNERIKYVLFLTYKSLKLVNNLTSALFFHSLHIVLLSLLLLSPIVDLLSSPLSRGKRVSLGLVTA